MGKDNTGLLVDVMVQLADLQIELRKISARLARIEDVLEIREKPVRYLAIAPSAVSCREIFTWIKSAETLAAMLRKQLMEQKAVRWRRRDGAARPVYFPAAVIADAMRSLYARNRGGAEKSMAVTAFLDCLETLPGLDSKDVVPIDGETRP